MKHLIDKLKDSTPAVDVHYRIGMRVIKTVIAVTVCLFIAWFSGSRDSLPIAAIASLVTMQATQVETLRIGVFRVIGTMIGGVFGIITILIGLFLPYYTEGLFIIVIPVMLLLNLYLCNLLNMRDSCTISCVVTIIVAVHIIIDTTFGDALVFALIRLVDTVIGVIVATVINLVPFKSGKISG